MWKTHGSILWPLSVTSTSGIPCLENMDSRAVIILTELVVDNFRISTYVSREIIHNNNISFTFKLKEIRGDFLPRSLR